MTTAKNPAANTAFTQPSSLRFVGITSLIIVICLSISSLVIFQYSHSEASRFTQDQMSVVKKQVGVVLQPLILTDDTVSMNVHLSALVEAAYINGLELTNPRGKVLARAGNSNGSSETVTIYNQQLAVATLTFYYSTKPANRYFNQLLLLVLSLAIFSSLCILIGATTIARRDLRTLNHQYKPLLKHHFSLELSRADHPDDTEQETAPNTEIQPVGLAIVNLDQPTATSTPIVENSEELVELLKPDNTQRMPHFTPQPTKADLSVELPDSPRSSEPPPVTKQTLEIDLNESAPVHNPTAAINQQNPLRRNVANEEQLDLYTLEHQLEISLKAEDAAYLLFIDCSSGRAPIEDHEEHSQLLTQYRKLVTQVSKIYGGTIELMANGDIRLLFDQGDSEDHHGTQALCAAKLFNQLYKYYNQRQITRMQPTLNIQASLVRGNKHKMELLREEAHFLTCTTLSNELISHTPLSEVSALKSTLLEGAKTQRHDEDKILILSLNPKYQNLLEQQARHLVKSS